jgi:hypothetical protein
MGTRMRYHYFPARFITSDSLPDGRPNQCTATTVQGNRCKNPLVHGGQFWTFSFEKAGTLNGELVYREVAVVSQEDFDRMQTDTCYLHSDY